MAAPTDWVPVLNTTGEVIPAGGLMKVTGLDSTTGALQVAKPDKDSDPAVCVNGFSVIPASGTGQGSFDPRAVLAYDPADGVPAAGDTWGAKSGTWLAKKGKSGFQVLGGAGLGLVNAVRVPGATMYSGVVVADVVANTTGSVTVSGLASPVPTWNQWSSTVKGGKKCIIGWVANESRFQFVAVDC